MTPCPENGKHFNVILSSFYFFFKDLNTVFFEEKMDLTIKRTPQLNEQIFGKKIVEGGPIKFPSHFY